VGTQKSNPAGPIHERDPANRRVYTARDLAALLLGKAVNEGDPAHREMYTADDLARLLQVSKRTIFRLRASGALPPPVHISTNIVRWRGADIRAYLDDAKNRKPQRRDISCADQQLDEEGL